jgi:hypothetical protein
MHYEQRVRGFEGHAKNTSRAVVRRRTMWKVASFGRSARASVRHPERIPSVLPLPRYPKDIPLPIVGNFLTIIAAWCDRVQIKGVGDEGTKGTRKECVGRESSGRSISGGKRKNWLIYAGTPVDGRQSGRLGRAWVG